MRPSRSISRPFARSIALRAASASDRLAASLRTAASSSWRARAVAIAGRRSSRGTASRGSRTRLPPPRARRALLPVRGDHHDRDRPFLEDPPRRLDAVEPRHLDVEDSEVRRCRTCELDCLLAVARFGETSKPARSRSSRRSRRRWSRPRRSGFATTYLRSSSAKAHFPRRPASSRSASDPPSSSRTRARTIDMPVPSAAD